MEIQQSMGYLLNVSGRLIKRKLDIQLKRYDITTAQWAVLKLLAERDHLSQAEIAERTNSDRATCGAVIEKLIGKGLLQKELFEEDRRSYQVKIVPTAIAMVEEVTLLAVRVNESAMEGLSEVERRLFVHCLRRVITNLGGDR